MHACMSRCSVMFVEWTQRCLSKTSLSEFFKKMFSLSYDLMLCLLSVIREPWCEKLTNLMAFLSLWKQNWIYCPLCHSVSFIQGLMINSCLGLFPGNILSLQMKMCIFCCQKIKILPSNMFPFLLSLTNRVTQFYYLITSLHSDQFRYLKIATLSAFFL